MPDVATGDLLEDFLDLDSAPDASGVDGLSALDNFLDHLNVKDEYHVHESFPAGQQGGNFGQNASNASIGNSRFSVTNPSLALVTEQPVPPPLVFPSLVSLSPLSVPNPLLMKLLGAVTHWIQATQ
jgi:hypothetical protein